jgi:hypothetical protein
MVGTRSAVSSRMNVNPFDPEPAPAWAPYRDSSHCEASAPTEHTPPPSVPSRYVGITTLAFAMLTLTTSLTTLAMFRAFMALRSFPGDVRARTPSQPSVRSQALDTAAIELARRSRRSLYIAPDVAELAHAFVITAGSIEGMGRETQHALDAYAATRHLWMHDVDNVLRLEREVTSVDLSCDDTVDVCATRLERVASIMIERRNILNDTQIHLRARTGEPVIEAVRAAALAEGMQVDVRGRTIFLTMQPTDINPPEVAFHSTVGALHGGSYIIARSAIDRGLMNPEQLTHGVNIAPETRGTNVVGVRISGVREGSTLAALGIANNDVLLRLNGFDLASPDQCLQAYSRIRSTDRVSLLLERGRRLVTLRYRITHR